MAPVISKRKLDYRARLEKNIRNYKNILIINVDMVGSKQMQQVRMALRGKDDSPKAEIQMGKNTIIRKVLREMLEEIPDLEKLLPEVYGNIGFVFTNDDLATVREVILSNKVPAAARAGVLAVSDCHIPAGPTGLDPGQTAFFQALNIATKIVRGAIEIVNGVHLIKKGEKVSPSAVSLLSKMGIKPFTYNIQVTKVYESGSLYDAKVLDWSDDDLLGMFYNGVRKLASLSLQIGVPNAATVPHSIANAFKKLVAIAVETDITFKEAEPFKEYLADPAAFAAKHGVPASEEKKDDAPAAAAAAPEEESEDEDMDFDLFD